MRAVSLAAVIIDLLVSLHDEQWTACYKIVRQLTNYLSFKLFELEYVLLLY